MPRIPEYISGPESLSPSAAGANAWESLARRIAQPYNAAASNEREGGRVRASAFKQQLWPFDIMELYDRRAAQAAQAVERAAEQSARDDAASRINVRVVGGGRTRDPFPDTRMPDLDAANRSIGGYGGGAGQIARGAGALGDMLSDGGYRAAARGGGGAGRSGDGVASEPLELVHGELVPVSAAQRAQRENNTATQQQMDQYSSDLADYQRRYYGYDRPPRDPNTDVRPGGSGLMREPGFPMTGSYTGEKGALGGLVPSPTQQNLYRTPTPDPATWNPVTWFGAPTYDGVERRE